VVVWDARSGAEVRRIAAPDETPLLAWSGDGATLALVAHDEGQSQVRLWRPLADEAPVPLTRVPGALAALVFAADGGSLVGWSRGRLARWTLPGGEVRVQGMADTRVSDLVISADGGTIGAGGVQAARCLAGACEVGVLHVFDGASLLPIGPVLSTIHPSLRVPAIGPAGEVAVVLRPGGRGLVGELWRLDAPSLFEEACALAGGDLTPGEWAHHVGERAQFVVCEPAATGPEPPPTRQRGLGGGIGERAVASPPQLKEPSLRNVLKQEPSKARKIRDPLRDDHKLEPRPIADFPTAPDLELDPKKAPKKAP
jgi:hypothetical protein